MKKVSIIAKISHEKFKSIVLMPGLVSVTSLRMALHMLSELALDYLIMIDTYIERSQVLYLISVCLHVLMV